MQEGRQPRFTMAEVAPVLNDLLQKLFGAFSLPDSRENEYIMRCVTRIITFVGAEVIPVQPLKPSCCCCCAAHRGHHAAAHSHDSPVLPIRKQDEQGPARAARYA